MLKRIRTVLAGTAVVVAVFFGFSTSAAAAAPAPAAAPGGSSGVSQRIDQGMNSVVGKLLDFSKPSFSYYWCTIGSCQYMQVWHGITIHTPISGSWVRPPAPPWPGYPSSGGSAGGGGGGGCMPLDDGNPCYEMF